MAKKSLQQNPSGAYVYAIVVNGVIRYIGKGRNGRARAHISHGHTINRRRERGEVVKTSKFYNGLAASLKKSRKISWYVIAEQLTDTEAFERERVEIASIPDGQLWNLLSGGKGGDAEFFRKFWDKPKNRQRASEIQKGVWERPGYRERQEQVMLVSCGTPEHRALRSKDMKQRLARDDYLEKHVSMVRARWNKDRSTMVQNLQRGRDRAKALGTFKTRTMKLWADPEYRLKLSRAQKARWTPEARKKISEKMKSKIYEPEYRARQAERARANWADPDYRLRHSAARKRTAKDKK